MAKNKKPQTNEQYFYERVEALDNIKYDFLVWSIWTEKDEDELLQEIIQMFTKLTFWKKELIDNEQFEICKQIDDFLIEYVATTTFYLEDSFQIFEVDNLLNIWREVEMYRKLDFNYDDKIEQIKNIRQEIFDFLQQINLKEL